MSPLGRMSEGRASKLRLGSALVGPRLSLMDLSTSPTTETTMNTTHGYSIKRAYYRGVCCPACGATGGIVDTNGEWSTAKCAYACTCGHEWAAADYAKGDDITLAVEVSR